MKRSCDIVPKRKKHRKKVKNLKYNFVFFSFIASYVMIGATGLSCKTYSLNTNEMNAPVMPDSFDIMSDIPDIMLSTCKLYSEYMQEMETAEEKPIESNPQLGQKSYLNMDFNHDCPKIDEFNIMLDIAEDEYSGMALENDFEKQIKEIANLYNIPYEIVLTIGERESAGNWNNNGVTSKTNDYGVFQINECNLAYIEEKLGYIKEDLLNDPIKNAEACIFLLKDIMNMREVTTLEDVFGTYNGWINWKNIPQSVEYANACCEIMQQYFPDFQYQYEHNTPVLTLR